MGKRIPRLHAQLGPTILRLCTDRSTSKQLELKLSTFLLHHIGQGDRDDLRIASGGETGETDSHTRLEELVSSLGRSHDLAEERLASTTTSQSSRHLYRVRTWVREIVVKYIVDTSKKQKECELEKRGNREG